jgi:hypothetical protein
MRIRRNFNPKRKLRYPPLEIRNADGELRRLGETIAYGGNPEHKIDPGDFGLTPPGRPRPDKTLCDSAGVKTRAAAESLLRLGVLRGFVSVQERNGYPQNIWVVDEKGAPFEAQLENPARGIYHGYPMPASDPFAEEILKHWSRGS